MSQVIGTVSRVTAKPWQDTTLYSFQIQNDGRWFRTGRAAPGVNEGQTIQFAVSDDGKNTVNPATISQANGGAPTSAPPTGYAPPPQQRQMNKSDYWAEKDKYEREVRQPSIERQAARNSAISLVELLVRAEALPGMTQSAAPKKKADVIENAVLHYTEHFLNDLPHAGDNPQGTVDEQGGYDDDWS